jgi:hypothetical protein
MLLDVFKVPLGCLSMVDEVFRKCSSIEVQYKYALFYSDARLLADLWFLQAAPQDALNSPRSRRCIYPFSYYHLHGIFQFFTYAVIFPIGYLVGRHAVNSPVRRPLHMSLQVNRY